MDRGGGGSGNMFQFHPALQPKKSSRATTPRSSNAVCPEVNEQTHSPSARKYLAYTNGHGSDSDGDGDADHPHAHVHATEQFGIPTGMPSPRSGSLHDTTTATRIKGGGGGGGATTERAARRTLRGSLHYLKHESIQLSRALVRSTRYLYRQLSLPQLLAYLLILFGLLSESFTPAPRYNVPIGIVLFMSSSSSSSSSSPPPPSASNVAPLRRGDWVDHRLVVAGLCFTTILDVGWLLRPQEGAFNGFFRIQIENATHLSLAMCAATKLWLLFAAYFDLGPDLDDSLAPAAPPPPPVSGSFSIRGLRYRVWSFARFLLPRKTLPRRSHLSYEVLMRVLGLVWIHGVCGVLLLLLGLISVMGLSGKAVFRSSRLGLPLPLVMLFKAASTLMSYVVASHNMSYHGCLKVAGCHALARYHEQSASDVVLKYNARWLRRVKHAKVVDAVAGVYLMAVYYSAVRSTTFIAGETVNAVLALTAMVLLVLDVWAPLLIMVVARCGAVLHQHHREGTVDVDPYFPNQLEWEDEEEDGGARRQRIRPSSSSSGKAASSGSGESSDGDDDSEQSSHCSSASGSSSSSSTDTTSTRRRRRQRSQRSPHLRRSSSQKRPLIPPLKRANSMLIVDAADLGDREDLTNGERPYWVRYWDDASGRAYLVHAVTSETVWEIGVPATPRTPLASARATGRRGSASSVTPRRVFAAADVAAAPPSTLVKAPSPHAPLMSASSFPPMSATGLSASSSARHSPRRAPHSARVSSHPTSESDIIVTTAGHGFGHPLVTVSPRGPPAPPQSAGRSPGVPTTATTANSSSPTSRMSSSLLSAEDFLLLWDALPDGGSFTCRVSKVPNALELTQHLQLHGFTVASDGLNLASLRTIHFYAIATATSSRSDIPSDSSPQGSFRRLSVARNAALAFFLGEFVFDSLSLKLYARFRCPEVDAIVPFVKKLQLKEIVGAYAPCD